MSPGNFEQYTFDGELDQIYNGVPDWIYEGIVFIIGSIAVFYLEQHDTGNYINEQN